MVNRACFSLVLFAALASLGAAEERYFNSAGVKIRYVIEGEGIPVVLIHGWQADAAMWGKELRPAKGYQLIALDCRGHGQSGKPRWIKDYGPKMADDVVRLLDTLKIKRAHLVGYSMGAFIVAKVLERQPSRVISAVFGGQAPILQTGNNRPAEEVSIFYNAVKRGKGLGAYIRYARPNMSPETADKVAASMFGSRDVRALAASGMSFPALAVPSSALSECRVPALFIHGSREAASTLEAVEKTRALMPRSSHFVVPGTDHMTTLIHPAFGKEIQKFLDQHSPQ